MFTNEYNLYMVANKINISAIQYSSIKYFHILKKTRKKPWELGDTHGTVKNCPEF